MRLLDVGECDRRSGGDVPDVLAVLLEEVGVAVGEGQDSLRCWLWCDDACSAAGRLERVASCLGGKTVDRGEAKQPLGIGLGGSGQRGQLWQAGAGKREWQVALDDLVQRGDQRLQVVGGEELDLVEQEYDARLMLGRPPRRARRTGRRGPLPVRRSLRGR